MSERIEPGNLGVEDVAAAAEVSRPTAFRWAREGRLPPPLPLPGPQQWGRETIEAWVWQYRRVREAESAMVVFGRAPELDPLLRKAARLLVQRLRDTSVPIVLRTKLAGIAEAVNWKPGELTPMQRRQARTLILRLLDLVSEGAQ